MCKGRLDDDHLTEVGSKEPCYAMYKGDGCNHRGRGVEGLHVPFLSMERSARAAESLRRNHAGKIGSSRETQRTPLSCVSKGRGIVQEGKIAIETPIQGRLCGSSHQWSTRPQHRG